jgi:hypothetical protein
MSLRALKEKRFLDCYFSFLIFVLKSYQEDTVRFFVSGIFVKIFFNSISSLRKTPSNATAVAAIQQSKKSGCPECLIIEAIILTFGFNSQLKIDIGKLSKVGRIF